MGKDLNLLPLPREFRVHCSGCIHGIVTPCKDVILSYHGNKVVGLIFAQERPKYICIMAPLKLREGSVTWLKTAYGDGGSLIQSKLVGKCFTEMRNLFSDFAGFGCGHTEPCRSSKRAILFSFLVHLSFLSGFRDYG